MSKWKCEICGKEFDNFQAQGFDNKVYCPLCFFKEKTNRLEKIRTQLKEELKYTVPIVEHNKIVSEKNKEIKQLKEVIEEVKTEISALMSKYFYEKDFSIEDAHLDKLLQILDKAKGENNE